MKRFSFIHQGAWPLVLSLCLSACSPSPQLDALGILQSATELAAAEFTLGKLIIADQQLRFMHVVPLNKASFLAHSRATLLVGVDFNRIRPEHVAVDGKHITLELPPIEVLDFDYPPSGFREIKRYSHLHPIGNTLDAAAMNKILQDAQFAVMKVANHLPIRQQAEGKVSNAVEQLLKLSGYQHIDISFAQDSLPLFDLPEPKLPEKQHQSPKK